MTSMMNGPIPIRRCQSVGYFQAAFNHALLMLWRRKHLLILLLIALLPGCIPLVFIFLTRIDHSSLPKTFFTDLTFHVYLQNFVPLISIFFGCSLVNEEMDNRTITLILTRPIPRSAWLFGRFCAFFLASMFSFSAGVGFLFGTCLLPGQIQFDSTSVSLLFHFLGIIALSLLAHIALCAFFGASQKKPMVLSLIVIYGWQGLALLMPGLIDFLTIEKYVNELLPVDGRDQTSASIARTLLESQKQEYLVGVGYSIMALLFITGLFLVLATLMVRHREYASAKLQH